MRRDNEILHHYADLSREFFKIHKVYRFRMKLIQDMDDEEINQKCHWFCEENNLIQEWNVFINENAERN